MVAEFIVVPLDFSESSENAVPYALALAKATGAQLHLVTVVEHSKRALIARVPEMAGDLLKQVEEHHERYLGLLSRCVRAVGVGVTTDVLAGDVAYEILRTLERCHGGMLAMATHGRSGLARWRHGSIASRLVREAPGPAMMVGPAVPRGGASASSIDRVLVPLDGSSLAESALGHAVDIAEALAADLVLARVLPWAAQGSGLALPEIDTVQADRDLMDAAHQYLVRAMERLGTRRRVETRVLRGVAADVLIELVAAEHIDLVVMASHTRAGLARAVLGSVAERLLHGRAPVVLVKPRIDETASEPDLATAGGHQMEARRQRPQRGIMATSATAISRGHEEGGKR